MLTSLRRLFISLAVAASTASAQGDSTVAHASAPSACLAAIPQSALTRVAVYISGWMDGGAPGGLRPAVDNELQAIADRVGALAGPRRDTLATGEPRLNWLDVDAAPRVRVVWHRDGTATWAVAADTADESHVDIVGGTGTPFLLRALADANAAGELALIWPSDYRGDSVAAFVRLYRTRIDTAGQARPTGLHPLLPVFSIAAPRERLVSVRKMVAPEYPRAAEFRGAVGRVLMRYVVDTTGRADPTTIRDDWPANRPRLTGGLAAYYRNFVDAARGSVIDGTFVPAAIGGCPVRQLVLEPFSFELR